MNPAVTVPPADRRAIVADAVAKLRRVTMLPTVTLRIIDLIQKNTYSAEDLEKIVSIDPALCLRILKVVNSAFYGATTPISSLKRALIVLGGPSVKNIALATSLGKTLHAVVRPGLSAPALWKHSLAVAAGAKLASAASPDVRSEDAFLAGLLHDIGFIVQTQADRSPGYLGDVTTHRVEAGPASLLEIEVDLFGATHAEFGCGLCESWRLPQFINDAIRDHHEPARGTDGVAALSSAVHIADVIAQQQGLGCGIDMEVGALNSAALETLKLSDTNLEVIRTSLSEVTEELEQALR